MPGKEPVLPLLSSTARTVDGTDGAQRRRPSATAADEAGGATQLFDRQDIQSTDELLYATRLLLPYAGCKRVQRLALGWCVPLLVKALELYLLINVFLEDTFSKTVLDMQMRGVDNAPDTNCPMSGGKNVYSISADYFISLSLMAAIYGAAVCTDDLMFVGRGMIGFCNDRLKMRMTKQRDAKQLQESHLQWGRLCVMCSINLLIHFFCLRAVAISVAISTSVATGVANFAVIFIVLELDQKVRHGGVSFFSDKATGDLDFNST